MRKPPILPLLEPLVRALGQTSAAVLEAPPGAGKTTCVPTALLDVGLARDRQILVTQPRRIAARLAARYVASELGQSVGELVGYRVRFESAVSQATRIVYTTEGVAMRRFIQAPSLPDVGVLVLDEFHERHLETDLLLALAKRLIRGPRPDLKLVVMSATLDAEPVARFLGDCPRLRSEGRSFPVTVTHAERPDDRPLDRRVTSAVREALKSEAGGSVLVFLPGAREIRRAQERLSAYAADLGVELMPLHGDLPISEQARAIAPSDRRKVLLSTNVAESSVTIEGVTAVVDSGLARIATHSPWSGLRSIQVRKVSRASAEQRAGRAGRTRPGRVLRLYTRGDFLSRPEQDAPEIARLDLAEALLWLHGAGVASARALEWLHPPSDAAIGAAETLLGRLGAVTDDGDLSQTGRRMLELPLPPRLARIAVEGADRGARDETALAAALLSERDIRLSARSRFDGRGPIDASGLCDVLELIDRFREAGDRPSERVLRRLELDSRAVRAVTKAARQIRRSIENRSEPAESTEAIERAVRIALLAGYVDRLAKRRTPKSRELTLSSGDTAILSELSVVREAEFLIALDAELRERRIVVRLASAVDPRWIVEFHPDLVEIKEELSLNAESGIVERVTRLVSGSVVLDEERSRAPPSTDASQLLARAARATGWLRERTADLTELAARIRLVREHVPEIALPDLAGEAIDRLVGDACAGLTSYEELKSVDLLALARASFTREQQTALDRHAPSSVTLPGGRRARVHYEDGKPPWIASRLQDFFGMSETPTVAGGRLPLTLHLLAPNQRAVQVTSDLAGFWERHYPAIRRELSRRYPKHAWPEDGRNAVPPPVRGRRGR